MWQLWKRMSWAFRSFARSLPLVFFFVQKLCLLFQFIVFCFVHHFSSATIFASLVASFHSFCVCFAVALARLLAMDGTVSAHGIFPLPHSWINFTRHYPLLLLNFPHILRPNIIMVAHKRNLVTLTAFGSLHKAPTQADSYTSSSTNDMRFSQSSKRKQRRRVSTHSRCEI